MHQNLRHLHLLALTVLLLLPASASAAASHTAQATLPAARPTVLAIDHADNLWVLEQRGVERLSPSGTSTLFPTPVARPALIAARNSGILLTPDSTVWFADGLGHIGRISPAGKLILFAPPAALGYPVALTSTASGTIWTILRHAQPRPGTCLVLAPATAPLPLNDCRHQPIPSTLVWATLSPSGTFTPVRLVPKTWSTPAAATQILDLAAAPNGTLWTSSIVCTPNATISPIQSYLDSFNPGTAQRRSYALPVQAPTDCLISLNYPCVAAALTISRDNTVWFTFINGSYGHISPNGTPQFTDKFSDLTHIKISTSGISATPLGGVDYFGVGHEEVSPNHWKLVMLLCTTRRHIQFPCEGMSAQIEVMMRLDLYSNIVYDHAGIGWFAAPCTDAIGRIDLIDHNLHVTWRQLPGTQPDLGPSCPGRNLIPTFHVPPLNWPFSPNGDAALHA